MRLWLSLYKFEALLTDREAFAPDVFSRVAADWVFMLEQGATSFWETLNGEADFSFAGRLTHPENLKPLFVKCDIECKWTRRVV